VVERDHDSFRYAFEHLALRSNSFKLKSKLNQMQNIDLLLLVSL